MSVKPEVELIFTTAPMENMFYVIYLENGERYKKGVSVEVEQETIHGLLIGTVTFDLG